MRNLLNIIVFVILLPIQTWCQINEDEFYNTTDFYLKIHKINHSDYLFYGNNGGIIRYKVSGNSFIQNFSGTRNRIVNLENHKDYVVGITDNYEFMASHDKGSHWIVSKLTDSIVSMDASDSFVVMASLFEDILISSNVGKSWEKIKVTGKYFRYIFIIDDRIYTIDKNNSIDYTDDFGDSWNNIKTPKELFDGIFVAQRDNNLITLRNRNSFFRLKNDQEIDKFDFSAEFIDASITYDKGFTYANANSNTREINYYEYDIENKTEKLISSNSNLYVYGNTFRVYDLEVENNLVLMTLENRTILKSIDYGNNWEIVTHTPFFNGGHLKVFDKNNWSIIGESLIFKSTDGGVTFRPGNDILIDTSNAKRFLSYINDYHFYNNDSAVFLIRHTYSNSKIDGVYTTNDGGITLKASKVDDNNLNFVADLQGRIIVRDTRVYGSGAGYTNIFYNLSDLSTLDSLNSIDSVYSSNFKTIRYGNKIYIFYSKITSEKNKTEATIAVSNDSLKTVKDIFSISNDSLNSFSGIFVSKTGSIYFTNSSQIPLENYVYYSYFRLDTETDIIHNVSKPFRISSFYQDQAFIEDQKYFTTNEFIIEDTSYKYKYVEVSIEDNEFVFDTIGDNSKGFKVINFLDTDQIVLYGGKFNIWKQIEPDRLTSIEQTESRTENLPIYPFAPSPNPAKEKIKVKFYTESIDKIGGLKVHLVNISTGKKVEIKDYDISFTNNWNGEIKFDISNFSIGSYLINLSIDDYNRSSKLIITK